MEIRQMKREEADAVGRIYAASWKAAYRGIVPQAYLDGLSEHRWAAHLADNTAESYVLLADGKAVGTSSICPARDGDMPGWGEIKSLYLLPEYFGKGYGRALLAFCVGRLKTAGYDRVCLWALADNVGARGFYETCGFRHDGAEKVCAIGGEDLAAVRYVSRAE